VELFNTNYHKNKAVQCASYDDHTTDGLKIND